MIFAKRVATILGLTLSLLTFLVLRSHSRASWQDLSLADGLEEYLEDEKTSREYKELKFTSLDGQFSKTSQSQFRPGIAKPLGSTYSRGLVMGRLAETNITWFKPEDFPDLKAYTYVVDDPSAPLHTPKNQGNEAMVYLSYIIDHYENLPDVSLFIHGHRMSWHANEMFYYDDFEMIRRLSSDHVTREGYMNLRCHWEPGCPMRIMPGAIMEDKVEQEAMDEVWATFFPKEPMPELLGAPCCAQFALSRDRIRSIPKARFEFYRNWLLHTDVDSWTSGRMFEYLWQKIFTGHAQHCPSMRICYCDGYGVCFRESQEFDYWFELMYKRIQATKALNRWAKEAEKLRSLDRARIEELKIEIPEIGHKIVLDREVSRLSKDIETRKQAALKLGEDPKIRAEIAGREWKEGNGY